jgi:hypothetical protein
MLNIRMVPSLNAPAKMPSRAKSPGAPPYSVQHSEHHSYKKVSAVGPSHPCMVFRIRRMSCLQLPYSLQ